MAERETFLQDTVRLTQDKTKCYQELADYRKSTGKGKEGGSEPGQDGSKKECTSKETFEKCVNELEQAKKKLKHVGDDESGAQGSLKECLDNLKLARSEKNTAVRKGESEQKRHIARERQLQEEVGTTKRLRSDAVHQKNEAVKARDNAVQRQHEAERFQGEAVRKQAEAERSRDDAVHKQQDTQRKLEQCEKDRRDCKPVPLHPNPPPPPDPKGPKPPPR